MREKNRKKQGERLKGVIIGGGFGGIGQAVQLLNIGIDNFIILDKNPNFGGTWIENTYPNCACDVASHVYSFSYFPNPFWSHKFSSQKEILRYAQNMADHYGLAKHAQFNSQVVTAHYNKATKLWTLTSKNVHTGEITTHKDLNFVISAVGQLNSPTTPKFAGLEDFKKPVYHSVGLTSDVDLEGKKVACIGFGPSAVQILPHLANNSGHLFSFIRSTSYTNDRYQHAYPSPVCYLFSFLPPIRMMYRWLIGTCTSFFIWNFAIQRDTLHGSLKHMCKQKIERELGNNMELRAQLACDETPFCKRILISDELLPALARPNVTIYRSPKQSLKSFTEGGIIVASNDGKEEEIDVDLVVMATGFKTTQFLSSFQVSAGEGDEPTLFLKDQWGAAGENTEAYYGILISNFPNLFALYGPHTNRGADSIIFMLECQQWYVANCINLLASSPSEAPTLTVKKSAMEKFTKIYDETVKTLSFGGACTSWYRVGGDGRIINNCHLSGVGYWWETLWVNEGDIEVK